MKKQKRHIKFKTPKRYRLSLFNENALNRIWTIKMGRKRLILLIAVGLLAVFCAGMMLMSLTPLRTVLPGYLTSSERRHLEEVDARVDSLKHKLAVYDSYLGNVTSIMTGEIAPDSIMTVVNRASADSMAVPADSVTLIGRGQAESEFVRMYSERENFVLDDRQDILAEAPLFVPPVKDAMVLVEDNPSLPKIEVTAPEVPVFSINRGTVVEQYTLPDGTFVVIIQHPDGYLSRYAGLSRIYTKVGIAIDAGSRIGQYTRVTTRPLQFELRRDGQSLNPLDYIPF